MWLKSWMSCCSGWWELLQGWRWTGPWIRSWAASSSTTFTSGSVSRSTKLFLSVRSDHENTAASLPRGFRFIYVLSPSRLHPPHVSLHRGDLVVRRPVSLPGSDLCPLAALWHGRLTHLPHLLLLRLRSQVRPQQLQPMISFFTAMNQTTRWYVEKEEHGSHNCGTCTFLV